MSRGFFYYFLDKTSRFVFYIYILRLFGNQRPVGC